MGTAYRIAMAAYWLMVGIASLWHPKAREWVRGRRGLLGTIGKDCERLDGRRVWFHCASLGEFEMARPVIEALKQQAGPPTVMLTFFSPSGYLVRKDWPLADAVWYLPLDTPANARAFIASLRPDAAVFVRYDLWYFLLREAKEQGAALLLMNAHFRPSQHFFRWYGGMGRRCLALFDEIQTVDSGSEQLARSITAGPVRTCGDTRYDRAMEAASAAVGFPAIERFKGGHRLIVCGSTWPEDEQALLPAIQGLQGVRWVIAPHEVAEPGIKRLERLIPGAVRFSGYAGQQADVLIVDSIGALQRLYSHADAAYVGGGFRSGLHNILEATAYGIPVVFGPHTSRFPDAEELAREGLALKAAYAGDVPALLERALEEDSVNRKAALLAFMRQRCGAKAEAVRMLRDALM